MITKRSIKTVFLLLILATLSASYLPKQKYRKPDKRLIQADKYYNLNQYYSARESYEMVLKKDSLNMYARFQSAECSRYMEDYKNALYHYEYIAKHPKGNETYPVASFYTGQLLKQFNRCKEATYYFEMFMKSMEGYDCGVHPKEDETKQLMKICKQALQGQ